MRAVFIITVLVAGCSLRLSGFACGDQSVCEASHTCVDGSCASIDPRCPSGYRYVDSAGGRAGQCASMVDASASTHDGPSRDGDVILDGPVAVVDAAKPVDLTPPFVCGQNNVYCEDFTSTTLSTEWTVGKSATGSVFTSMIDGGPPGGAHHGAYAFHVNTPSFSSGNAATGVGNLAQQKYFFANANDYWARVWVYFSDPIPHEGYNGLLAFQGVGGDYHLCQTGFGIDSVIFFNDVMSGSPIDAQGISTTITSGKWICIEEHIGISTSGPLDVFVDGTEISSPLVASTLSDVVNGTAYPPEQFQLNFNASGSASDTTSHDTWYDDIVLSTQRVGCAFEP